MLKKLKITSLTSLYDITYSWGVRRVQDEVIEHVQQLVEAFHEFITREHVTVEV